MAKNEVKETQPQQTIAETIDGLRREIQTLLNERERLIAELGGCEDRRLAAKQKYESALDVGDEKAMGQSLSTIRDSLKLLPQSLIFQAMYGQD